MEKSVVEKASSVELAVEKALGELGARREDVEIEVLSKGGLFQKAEVRVTLRQTAAAHAEEFVSGLLRAMGLSASAKASESDGEIVVEISGEDSGTAIGYRGEALDAIQFLTRTYLNQEKLGTGKVVVDCENYRAKRRETLVALAGRLAEKAYRTRRKVALEPMNPFERRIIHSALIDSEIAETHSEGEDSARHVVIVPKGVELREDRRRDNRRDGRGKDRRRDGDRPANRRNGDDRRRERTPRTEEEVPDGNEYRGYFTDGFVKADPVKTGPPKFKSFGGKKKF